MSGPGKVVAIDYNSGGRREVVDFLEFLVEEARAGRIDGIAVTTVLSEDRGIGGYFRFVDERERPFTMVGGLELLKRRVMRAFLEDGE